MKICECCGQEIRFKASAPKARTHIQVDDALLALCNRAHDDAARRGRAHVEVAHLVWCLTGWSAADRFFARFEVRRETLADAAYQWLAVHVDPLINAAPVASGDLVVLLRRAENIAAREQRGFATPLDFVEALFTEAADLTSAEFVSWGHGALLQPGLPASSAHQRASARERQSGAQFAYEAGSSPVSSDRGSHERPVPASRLSDRLAEGRDAISLAALVERLERQERLIAELRAEVIQPVRQLAPRAGSVSHSQPANTPDDGPPALREDATNSNMRTVSLRQAPVQPVQPSSRAAIRSSALPSNARLAWRQRVRRTSWRKRNAEPASASADVPVPRRSLATSRPSLSIIHTAPRDTTTRDERDRMEAESEFDGDDADAAPGEREKRFYLAPDDEIVRAPSIGNRTAGRLVDAGIRRVRDLLKCNPADVASRAGGRFITAARIVDWQDQARLVCTIPWLRGTHAQLLVGAGYRQIADVENADGVAVWNDITRFAMTRDGQSVLRANPPPDVERVAQWVEHASLAEPARAA